MHIVRCRNIGGGCCVFVGKFCKFTYHQSGYLFSHLFLKSLNFIIASSLVSHLNILFYLYLHSQHPICLYLYFPYFITSLLKRGILYKYTEFWTQSNNSQFQVIIYKYMKLWSNSVLRKIPLLPLFIHRKQWLSPLKHSIFLQYPLKVHLNHDAPR